MKMAFLMVFFIMALSVSALAATQNVNVSITNSTVTVQSGGTSASYTNTPSNQTFQYSVSDCQVNNSSTNFSIDYGLIKNNTVCQPTYVANLTCPQPTCNPSPVSCPACPTLDYGVINDAIKVQADRTIVKLGEVNSSIISSKKESGFPNLNGENFLLILAAIVGWIAYFNRKKLFGDKGQISGGVPPRDEPK